MASELVDEVVLSGEATCVCVRGARLVLGGGDGAAALLRWRGRRGAGGAGGWERVALRPRAHRYGVAAAAFSPAGLLLATAGVDGAVRLWTADDLSLRRELVAPQASAVCAVAWGGARVVATHADGAVRVWRARGSLLAAVRAHDDALRGLALLADNALLLTATADGVVKVYNFDEICSAGVECEPAPPPLLWEDGAHDLGVLCAAAAGRTAATGGHDALVRLWHVSEHEGSRCVAPGARLQGHAGAVTALAAARGVLASAALDGTARVWSLPAGLCLRVLRAHRRYLTCLALPQHAKFVITGSNDKMLRMWSLSDFDMDSSLEPICSPEEHFGLGDLEGIAPIDEDMGQEYTSTEASAASCASFKVCDSCEDREEIERYGSAELCQGCGGVGGGAAGGGRSRCVWSERGHSGAINCIAVADKYIATCSSDGWVRVYSYNADSAVCANGDAALRLCAATQAHAYPALAVHFDPSGIRLLCTGLDGRAVLLDAESGAELSSVCVCAGAAASEAGGGGVRAARVSPPRAAPPRALLATDDGVAAVWLLDDNDITIVASGLCEGALCCAWSDDGRAAALGAGAGELRLLAARPADNYAALCRHSDAHDLGVLSCDFASAPESITQEDSKLTYILATGGRDGSLKLWRVTLTDDEQNEGVSGWVQVLRSVSAHAGGVASVAWRGARLASAGADRWPRVWGVRTAADTCYLDALGVASVGGAAPGAACGAAAAALLSPALLAVGSLLGELALWRLPEVEVREEELEVVPRFWELSDVIHWLHDFVTRRPGGGAAAAEEAALEHAARAGAARGAALLDGPLHRALALFGLADEEMSGSDASVSSEVSTGTRRRLLDELRWLRHPRDNLDPEALPHRLLCPLSHGALLDAVRAADGYTYSHAALLELRLARPRDVLLSPITNRRMHSSKLSPNYRLLEEVRRLCGWAPQPAE